MVERGEPLLEDSSGHVAGAVEPARLRAWITRPETVGITPRRVRRWPPAAHLSAPPRSAPRSPRLSASTPGAQPGLRHHKESIVMLRAGSKRGIAARVGSWSARHKKPVLAGWLVFIVASVVLGGAVGTHKLT